MLYYIYRTNSNASNQSMVDDMVVSIIEAKTITAAEEIAKQEEKAGKFNVYANQFISVVPETEVTESEDDLWTIHEEEEYRCRLCPTIYSEDVFMEAWEVNNTLDM